MKKSLLFGFAAALTLASCTTNDEVLEVAKQQEMSFTAFANKSTKAPIQDLTKDEGTFGLFGYKSKTGQTNEPVFNNTIVTYNTSTEGTAAWIPADIRYWDNTCSYKFFAYAPSDGNIKALITCDPVDNQMTITDFEVNNEVRAQKDFLIATKVERVNTSGTSVSKDQIDFTFHHILTKVNIQFAKGAGSQITVLNSINLKDVPTKGDCMVSFNDALKPTAIWAPASVQVKKNYPQTMANDGLDLTTTMQTAIENLLMIPQQFSELELDIVFTVNTEVFKRTVNLAAVNSKWESNTNLTYKLTILNGSDNANDKIELGVEKVENWTNTTNPVPTTESSIN